MTDTIDHQELLKAIDSLNAAPEISYLKGRPKLRRWLKAVLSAAEAYSRIGKEPSPEAIVNEEMAQVLQDVVTLCEQGEFEADVFLDFIRDGKTRHLMQYHRDHFHKLTSKQ